ncbi:MAG: hypothetical protein H7240_11860 [Glaciimonas sp.]|nr:hypothetical protein [Glaciimonas sp.]
MKSFSVCKFKFKKLNTFLLMFVSILVLSPLFVNCSANLSANRSAFSLLSSKLDANEPLAIGYGSAPANIGQLFGCKNPYVNNSLNFTQWGATSAVYVDPATMTQTGNYPTYSSNTVFWTSREAGPGLPVLMSGAFTGSDKTIRLLAVPPGMTDWQSSLRNSGTTVSGTNMASTGLRFTIPLDFPTGTYAVRIEDSSADPVELLINAPTIEWAMGVPASNEVFDAPNHQIYTCGAEAGQVLRIVGKNFLPNPSVVLLDQSNTYFQLAVRSSDETSISVSIPSSLSSGTYYIWIGSNIQDAASSAATPITIYSNSTTTLSGMSCDGLVGDGSTDNTATLSNCFSDNAASASADNPYYLALPAGKFVITDTIKMYPHQYLIGDSMGTTPIIGPSSNPPTTWIQGSQWFGIENLSIVAPVTNALIMSDQSGDPVRSGHIILNSVNIYSTGTTVLTPTAGRDYSDGNQQMIMLTGPDIRVLSSTIDSSSNVSLAVIYGDGVFMSQNTFNQARSNWVSMQGDQNCIFEQNLLQGSPGEYHLWAGIFYSRPFWVYSPSMITQNIYSGYNTYANLLTTQGQGSTTDGGAQAYFGTISSSNSNTVTLANDLAYGKVGASNPQTLVVTIVQGTGVGEYRMVQGIDGRTVTLDHPWDILPDQSSIVSVTSSIFRIGVSHSTFTNVAHGALLFYGNTFDSSIENNQISNGQLGVSAESYGPIYLPLVNIDMINNSVSVGENTVYGEDPTGSGIFIRDVAGGLVSGIYLRGNSVESPLTFNLAGSVSGISSLLIDGNNLTFDSFSQQHFLGSNPGMLIQNNN